MTCKEAILLYEQRPKTRYKGFRLQMHFLACTACRQYRRFSSLVHEHLQSAVNEVSLKVTEKLTADFLKPKQ